MSLVEDQVTGAGLYSRKKSAHASVMQHVKGLLLYLKIMYSYLFLNVFLNSGLCYIKEIQT